MTLVTTLNPPRSFVPPVVRPPARSRMAHLDPRPLYPERALPESPWRSPSFYVALLLVAPVAVVARAVRAVG